MIFLTVGTHEQPFNRLLIWIDELINEGFILDEVFAQIGYSTYIPANFKYCKFLDYNSMQAYFRDADIVITHGGPSSFIEALRFGKTPIVVPREKQYGEHVNNHQKNFCGELVKRGFPIFIVSSKEELKNAINRIKHENYKAKFVSHNDVFVTQFTNYVMKLFDEEYRND